MKKIILVACFCLTGCATVMSPPKYATNWSQLEVGMTKEKVVALLGEPPSRVAPIEPDPQSDRSLLENLAGAVIVKTLFDGWLERWHYGHFEFFENLFRPSDKAYVVYFNGQGKVVKFRRPLTTPEQKKTANQPDAGNG